MSKKHVPVYTTGSPGVPSTQVIPMPQVGSYSAYTGERIGSGGIPWGTKSDAPKGHPNHGKSYHGGIQVPGPDGRPVYMMHRLAPRY